jgi:hypothetical protein
MIVAAAIMALAAAPVAATPAPQVDRHIVFWDAGRDVAIRYDFTPAGVEFSARLTDGWAFTVGVDGDQNGVWGMGVEREGLGTGPTPDRRFGQTSHGFLCVQYVLSTDSQDLGVYSSSLCGALPSKASLEANAVDLHDRALIRLKIPYDELFGTRPEAHIQICLWDGHERSCQHSPAEPVVLTRPTPAAPAPRG